MYARISLDRSGEAAGVQRQVRLARERAEREGWTVVGEYADNSISAHKDKHRPAYEQVLDLVRNDEIDYVVVYQITRLTRNRRERVDVSDLFGEHKVGIMCIDGADMDPSTADGRVMLGLLGEIGSWESDVKSERITAEAADRARKGRPHTQLGYGWEKDEYGRWVEHPIEGAIVREIVKRLIGGDSMRGIASDLNERKVPTPGGKKWYGPSVGVLARRESNAAIRIYRRGEKDEMRYDASWPALIDKAEHEKVVAVLESGPRRRRKVRPGKRFYLLTGGIGECWKCRGDLRQRTRGNGDYYECTQGHVGRGREQVDLRVRDAVIAYLAKPNVLEWLAPDDSEQRRAAARVEELRDRLDGAARAYSDGKLGLDRLLTIEGELNPQIDIAEAEHRRLLQANSLDALAEVAGAKAKTRWDEMTIARQRAVVEAVLDKVIIKKATTKGRFDRADVALVWHKEPNAR